MAATTVRQVIKFVTPTRLLFPSRVRSSSDPESPETSPREDQEMPVGNSNPTTPHLKDLKSLTQFQQRNRGKDGSPPMDELKGILHALDQPSAPLSPIVKQYQEFCRDGVVEFDPCLSPISRTNATNMSQMTEDEVDMLHTDLNTTKVENKHQHEKYRSLEQKLEDLRQEHERIKQENIGLRSKLEEYELGLPDFSEFAPNPQALLPLRAQRLQVELDNAKLAIAGLQQQNEQLEGKYQDAVKTINNQEGLLRCADAGEFANALKEKQSRIEHLERLIGTAIMPDQLSEQVDRLEQDENASGEEERVSRAHTPVKKLDLTEYTMDEEDLPFDEVEDPLNFDSPISRSPQKFSTPKVDKKPSSGISIQQIASSPLMGSPVDVKANATLPYTPDSPEFSDIESCPSEYENETPYKSFVEITDSSPIHGPSPLMRRIRAARPSPAPKMVLPSPKLNTAEQSSESSLPIENIDGDSALEPQVLHFSALSEEISEESSGGDGIQLSVNGGLIQSVVHNNPERQPEASLNISQTAPDSSRARQQESCAPNTTDVRSIKSPNSWTWSYFFIVAFSALCLIWSYVSIVSSRRLVENGWDEVALGDIVRDLVGLTLEIGV